MLEEAMGECCRREWGDGGGGEWGNVVGGDGGMVEEGMEGWWGRGWGDHRVDSSLTSLPQSCSAGPLTQTVPCFQTWRGKVLTTSSSLPTGCSPGLELPGHRLVASPPGPALGEGSNDGVNWGRDWKLIW